MRAGECYRAMLEAVAWVEDEHAVVRVAAGRARMLRRLLVMGGLRPGARSRFAGKRNGRRRVASSRLPGRGLDDHLRSILGVGRGGGGRKRR